MKKTLLLFEQIETFEQFFATNISHPLVDVYTPYRAVSSQVAHNIRAISKRLPGDFFHRYWLEAWKDNLANYDTIVVFDNAVTPKLLKYIKEHISSQTALKIWLWNVPNEHIDYLKENFDVYCFDKTYSEKQGLSFIEQFYILDNIREEQTELLQDFYFIGVDKGRLEQIYQLAEIIEDSQMTYLFDIFSNARNSDYKGINYLDTKITYSEIIEKIQQSKAIVEINKEGQMGLTLRALESIFFKRKLITTNSCVKNYDFYHPNNIFVLEQSTAEDLIEFMSKPYVSLPESTIEKYSFSNWISTITK
ncbi:TPA: glycosyltransferase [Streptococcus suis]|uniref:glycosyltransferase n=1 Tax=Streptococcus sp. 2020WUSS084 TaxID=2983279 RepID=UPI001556F944|nr:glycosyltransferase [Streptococcus suis]NQO20984.1 glycosyltransferase [Streptococcus suis]NQO79844.1 glycosyltransferase [Streptococcus suis]NQO88257.1 glycosyltransferase [Streptococcus suis]NQP66325.1 glycosyltransferase [Streptococcus suis]